MTRNAMLATPPHVQCGVLTAAGRCLAYPDAHPTDHAYVSLMLPCTHCSAAIAWSDGAWRDTLGGTAGHDPKPGYVVDYRQEARA